MEVDVDHSAIGDNIFNYLKQLDERVWHRLFLSRACLRAIFRSLGELEQLIIFRLLYIQQAVSERALKLWMSSDAIGELRQSLSVLQSYKILYISETSKDGKQQLKLNSDFRDGFIALLSNTPITYDNELTFLGRFQGTFGEDTQNLKPEEVKKENISDSFTPKNVNKKELETDTMGASDKSMDVGNTLASGSDFMDNLNDSRDLVESGDVDMENANKSLDYTQNQVSVDTPNDSSPRNPGESVKISNLTSHAKNKLKILVEFLVTKKAIRKACHIYELTENLKKLKKENPQGENVQILEKRIRKLNKKSKVVSQDLFQIFERFGMTRYVKPNEKSGEVRYSNSTPLNRQTLSWLLKDVKSQLISLIVGYLQNLENGLLSHLTSSLDKDGQEDKSSIECIDAALESVTDSLLLLLSLSQARPGDSFSTKSLTKSQFRILRLLYELGIVYYKSIKGPFYVLDLSFIVGPKNLVPSNSPLSVHTSISFTSEYLPSKIIVQSNFKVYVYTVNNLQFDILNILCEVQARTPNMVVGVLTRESAQRAFKSGITSHEIIRFFSSTNTSTFPENVIRQLRMWEAERNRVELSPAILIKRWDREFLPDLFQRTVRWAQSKRYELFHTKWPQDPHSEEYQEWLKGEMYLACKSEAKEEVIEKIRQIRNAIENARSRVT
ncbi:conserved hypothetical protein [Theileria equi strain WA]|uniref:General transcription factor IIH subunit 4 n=1 Tax=Theileria equi strain WA TaxID=1537102 RepID=L1LFX4_THEEQ|nr:conserved hypothetical protein [Theileria equi strain WA]EKX74165.1 conserved hypothetical protein [Theileria equi strain WA]|eukprot:XP_004833617.1 conserved hypothetical protein [Theileria equi strain WA]